MVFSALRRIEYLYGLPPLDNFIYRLCYRWTVLLLTAFSFILTCKLKFGYSFTCLSRSATDAYERCYYASLFTAPFENELIPVRYSDIPKRYVNYYAWVNLVFLVHAVNFYAPHLLWKSYERGYVYRLTAGVQKYSDKEEKRSLKLCHLAKYVFATRDKHKLYASLYIFFEILNFVICVSHTLWLVSFFDVTGKPDSISYDVSTWSGFQNFYFPPEAACTFETIGSSGDMQRHGARCQLPLNSLHMKMFLFLYAWYMTIAVLTACVLVYRFLLLSSSFRVSTTKSSSPFLGASLLRSVFHQMSFSDWFFLSRLQNAMSDVDFAEMMDKIAIVSQGKDPQGEEYKRFSILDDTIKDTDPFSETSRV